MRRVAIKVLRSGAADGTSALKREAQALAAIRHPSLPILHSVGRYRGCDYLIMEHITGTTLAERLADEGWLPIREALRILVMLADALAVVHAAAVVHRDVKPANVMMSSHGRLVLLDFGLMVPEALVGASTQLRAAGTLEYMAPESIDELLRDVVD